MRSWLKLYLQPRLLVVLALGFVSGLPLALTASTLSAWFTDLKIDKTSIGLFASVATPYALKFLWAPLMDAYQFPLFSRLLGHRRGWILATQIGLVFSIIILGLANPSLNPWLTALAALIVATFSASQDIVIDAYRVEILNEDEQKIGAGMVQFGYRFGMLASGAGALALADHVSWEMTYFIMSGFMLIGIITILLAPEPAVNREIKPASIEHLLRDYVIAPFSNFTNNKNWLQILLFIMLYKLGDAFLGIMTNPFLIEIGFTKTQIAAVVKIYGLIATLVGLLAGSMLALRIGTVKTLMICGIGHALTNLMFVVQARVGADINILALGISLENFSGGMTASAFVAFISALCHSKYTATQYALLSSLAAIGRTLLTTTAGWTADNLGWEIFFIISVLLAVPSLVLLWWLSKRLKKNNK